MWHSSWYLSPQYTSYVPESNFGFFGGPILNFHALKLEWENESAQKKRPVNIGAMLGLRVNTTGRWEWFVAYHWSPRLQYDSSSTTKVNGSNTRTFSLPSVEIGFSCLKTGFSYYFPFSGKK